MNHDINSDRNDIDLRSLEISEDTIRILELVGMISVQDCLDFLERGGDATITVPPGFSDVFFGEIVSRLRAKGYLPDK